MAEVGFSTVWTLPCKSQEFQDGPVLKHGIGPVTLAYDFELPEGGYAWEQIVFTNVLGVMFTIWTECNVEQIDAYDRLQDVVVSTWLESLKETRADIHHYRIFFDDFGCYEFLASGFVSPATERDL